jgi:hypothetical protein
LCDIEVVHDRRRLLKPSRGFTPTSQQDRGQSENDGN